MNIAEFAALVGTTSKTIYGKINNYSNLPVNEQLKTVKEKVKGRDITLIITDTDQINYYKNLYGKEQVIEGEYYETVTDINSNKPVNDFQDIPNNKNNNELLSEMFNKLLTLNNDFNNRIERVNDELITYKSKTLLLEDAKGREGYYINEINELKKENNRNKFVNKLLITVITILIMLITVFITYTIATSAQVEQKSDQVTDQVSVQVEPKAEPKPQPVKKPTVQKTMTKRK